MRAQFVRGSNTQKEILDTLLDRRITVELDAPFLEITRAGELDKRKNKDILDLIKKNNVKYKLDISKDFSSIILTGTKEELIPIVSQWDAHPRTDAQAQEALRKDWDGTLENLYDIIG